MIFLEHRIKHYLEWLQIRNYTPRTVTTRQEHLGQFLIWCSERDLNEAEAITRPILVRYQKHLFYQRKENGEPLAARTQQGRLTSIRMLFKWLTKENYLPSNPASEIELPRLGKALPKAVLTVSEAELIINQPNVNTALGLRDRAILETLYSTGIRRLELIGLSIWGLDMSRGVLMIRHGKGNRDRVVPIGERAMDWVFKYIEEIRPLLLCSSSSEVLFCSEKGQPMTTGQLTYLVRKYIKAAEVNKEGSCHLFRHTMATLMLENGADIRFIQEILGHQKLETTQVYTRVSINQLKKIHTSTHPAGRPSVKPYKSKD